MKAVMGPVVNVRPVKSQGITRIEIEVPIEHHVGITELLFDKVVLLTLASQDLRQYPYGVMTQGEAPAPGAATEPATHKSSPIGTLCQSAVKLCKEERFQRWVALTQGVDGVTSIEEGCALFIREQCGVQSRKELDANPHAKARFMELMREYNKWIEENP